MSWAIDPDNGFECRSLTVPYNAQTHIPAKHNFSQTFECENFDERFMNESYVLCVFVLMIYFILFLFLKRLFYLFLYLFFINIILKEASTQILSMPGDIKSTVLMKENHLSHTPHICKLINVIFPVYNNQKYTVFYFYLNNVLLVQAKGTGYVNWGQGTVLEVLRVQC